MVKKQRGGEQRNHASEAEIDPGGTDVERDDADGRVPRHRLDLGWRARVRDKWVKACAVAWPVAAITALFIVPSRRLSAERIVALIDGRA